MCLTRVARVRSIPSTGEAVVDLDGREHVVSLAALVLAGVDVRVDDWVLIHTGLAVEIVDERTATELLEDLPGQSGPLPPEGALP